MKVLLEIVVCVAFWYLLLLIAIIRRNGKFYIIFVINNRVLSLIGDKVTLHH